ncbi:MAG: MFS transporter [Polyangiales bacterium]|nr:MFS transporter [Myxococcales bacterium]MCB9659737.1 MFS transporter [Sandaracinaceae bacterium]
MSPSAPGGDHGDRGGLPDADESGSGTGAEDHGALPVAGLATLLALYFVQGLPYGFQTVAVPVILIERGVGIESITLLGVGLGLPWMLKLLWAPWVDTLYWPAIGRRRSWLLPMQAGLALACAALAVVGIDGPLPLVITLVLGMSVFSATMDIAVDGYAIDLLEERHLGYGNIAQVVGAKIGMLVGGGLLLSQVGLFGYRGVFTAMCGCVLTVLAWTAVRPEPEGRQAVSRSAPEDTARGSLWETARPVREALQRALARPDARALLLFVFTYKAGESMADALFKPFLVESLGYATEDIGRIVGTWGMLFSLMGSFMGGLAASHMRLLRALTLFTALRALPVAAEWWLVAGFSADPRHVLVITCAEHFFGGALTTATFAFMMSRVDARIGASHYTLLATLEVLGKVIVSAPTGFLAARFGYAAVFGLGTVLSFLFLGALIPLWRAEPPQDGSPSVF